MYNINSFFDEQDLHHLHGRHGKSLSCDDITMMMELILMQHELIDEKEVHHLHDLCLGKTSQLCPGGGNCR